MISARASELNERFALEYQILDNDRNKLAALLGRSQTFLIAEQR